MSPATVMWHPGDRSKLATASNAHRIVPVMLVTFAVTVALGLGVFLVVR